MLTSNGSPQDSLFTADRIDGGWLAAGLDGLAARLDRMGAAPAGYVLRRLLLVNYWHFDYEEIVVPHGRLFLLGENGSGKSTILGATIPMLLDGVVRPERLDTFGSSQRRIDHYVLGQRTGGATYPRRTSYVALEFAWHAAPSPNGDGAVTEPSSDGTVPPPYITVGICFAGNADAQETVRPFRFVLTSGKRLGIDLPLKDRQNRVYDANYFRTIVRDNGVITDRQSEYRDLVARSLFGFRDAQPLEHLVNVLLLLRRPGLSNELHTFSDVYDYLKRALPPLPEEITRNTTEAFARIDELRLLEGRLQRQADACARIYAADITLARVRARQHALALVLADREARERDAFAAAKEEALARTERDLEQTKARHARIEADLRGANQTTAALEASALAHSAAQLADRLGQAEAVRDSTQRLLDARERGLADHQRAADELRARLASQERAWAERRSSAQDKLSRLLQQASASFWTEGQRAIEPWVAGLATASLDQERDTASVPRDLAGWIDADLTSRLADRRRDLDELAAHAADLAEARDREGEVRRQLEVAQRATAATSLALAEARTALAGQWQTLVQHFDTLADDARSSGASEESWLGLLTATDSHDRPAIGVALATIERELAERDAASAAEQEQLSQEIGEIRAALDEVDRELSRRRAEPEVSPPRRPHRARARQRLRELGVDGRPLYALVDFWPSVPEERRGQVERMLDDAGLLDTLLIRHDDLPAVEALLRADGLADCRLTVPDRPLDGPCLADILTIDPAVADDPDWPALADHALRAIALAPAADPSDRAPAVLDSSGAWTHGLLAGFAGREGPAGFIGQANRRERRRQEIERLSTERSELAERLAADETARDRVRRERDDRRAVADALRRAGDDRALSAAETRLQERLDLARRAEAAEREVAAEVERRGEMTGALAAAVARRAVPLLGLAAPDARQIQLAARAAIEMSGTAQAAKSDLERLVELQAERERDRRRWEEERAASQAAEAARGEARAQLDLAHDAVRRAREQLDAADLRDFQRQLETARRREGQLNEELLQQVQLLGTRESQVATLHAAVSEARAMVATADQARDAALAVFANALALNPDVVDDAPVATADDQLALARGWYPAGPVDADQLDRDTDQARERRRATFDEERGFLIDHDLAILGDARDRVIANAASPEERILPDLLRLIQSQLRDNQLLLNSEEERLFKDYLFGTGLNAIHRTVQAADALVWRVNEILQGTPLGGERYELRLESAADRFATVAPLARYHALFRKDPATITDDERRVLLEGVRGAVAEAHRRAAEEEGVVFAAALEQVFDYREWYVLNLYVTDATGLRQRINHRTARARSGAQQLFALYVPLFAALAALYHGAEPWAPRLFAMDEAFDKVSEDNVTQLLGFLVDLGFQWIVASPRLSGAGREVLPACADWQLVHDAANQLAQAIPLIYCDGQLLDGQLLEA